MLWIKFQILWIVFFNSFEVSPLFLKFTFCLCKKSLVHQNVVVLMETKENPFLWQNPTENRLKKKIIRVNGATRFCGFFSWSFLSKFNLFACCFHIENAWHRWGILHHDDRKTQRNKKNKNTQLKREHWLRMFNKMKNSPSWDSSS